MFFSVANLLNLEVDILFFDTTSTYWERDSADDALLDDGSGEEAPGAGDTEQADVAQAGSFRTYGHSKDHRGDLP